MTLIVPDAPANDAAFAKANLTPANVCTALPKATLTKVLLYHVVPGSLPASKVLPAKGQIRTLKTVLGRYIAVNQGATIFTTSGNTAGIMVRRSSSTSPRRTA
jgi:uncharacterized surface protein with fasciclin (FAS1) repeats